MGEEIALKNGQMSDFHGLVTLTLTSDRVILHTVMHHTSTSTYIPNFIEIEKTFCGRTDGHLRPTNVIRSTRRSRPKKGKEEYLYSAFYILCISQSAQAWITQFYLLIHHACLFFVSVHQMAPPLIEVEDIQLQLTTHLLTQKR